MIPGSATYQIMEMIYDAEMSKKNIYNIIYPQQFYGISNFSNFTNSIIDRVFDYLIDNNLINKIEFPPHGYSKGGYQISPMFIPIMEYSKKYYNKDIDFDIDPLEQKEVSLCKILHTESFSKIKECFNRKEIYDLISEEYKLSMVGMDLYLKSLCNKGYLEKIERAKYQLTRKFFLFFELNHKNKHFIELENKIDELKYQFDKHLIFEQFNVERRENVSKEETQ